MSELPEGKRLWRPHPCQDPRQEADGSPGGKPDDTTRRETASPSKPSLSRPPLGMPPRPSPADTQDGRKDSGTRPGRAARDARAGPCQDRPCPHPASSRSCCTRQREPGAIGSSTPLLCPVDKAACGEPAPVSSSETLWARTVRRPLACPTGRHFRPDPGGSRAGFAPIQSCRCLESMAPFRNWTGPAKRGRPRRGDSRSACCGSATPDAVRKPERRSGFRRRRAPAER